MLFYTVSDRSPFDGMVLATWRQTKPPKLITCFGQSARVQSHSCEWLKRPGSEKKVTSTTVALL